MNNSVKLHDNCALVNGAIFSIICDLQYGKLFSIPTNSLKKVYDSSCRSFKFGINGKSDEFINLLIKHNIVSKKKFKTKKIDLFHFLSLPEPFDFTDAIIDVIDKIDLDRKIMHLNQIKVKFVSIRLLFEIHNKDEFIALVNKIYSLNIYSYEISILRPNFSVDYENLFSKYQRIFILSERDCDINEKLAFDGRYLIRSKDKMDVRNCGVISHLYFRLFFSTFIESIHHNSCLNRKISIDADGNIKNCPSMSESFGNIRDTTLAEAIEKPGFKKYWDINKDKIHVCKDCEFRYICTDCRAYVEDPDDILSKPLKCGYNPYTGEWSEWSTNPLKQKVIDYYGMRDMVNGMNIANKME